MCILASASAVSLEVAPGPTESAEGRAAVPVDKGTGPPVAPPADAQKVDGGDLVRYIFLLS